MVFPRYIDTHCHLNHEDFGDEWQSVVPRALEEDIWIILVGHDYRSSARAIEIAREFPYGVYAAVGLHPRFVSESEIAPRNVGLAAFRELLSHPKVVAVGEVGIDLGLAHDALEEDRLFHQQSDALLGFLTLADVYDLPLLLHARGGDGGFGSVFEQYTAEKPGAVFRGIVHHVVGAAAGQRQFSKWGLTPSVTGFAARSHTSHELIQSLAQEELLVESECVHLVSDVLHAPRALPAHLPGAIGAVAAIRGEDHDAVRGASTKNALRIFSKIIRNLPH